jgi:energy-coupling factor transporter ATP-binding protein EcfA2
MELNFSFNIQKIFVGREEELKDLHNYWKFTHDGSENKIYVLLNAPGVGKTVLLKKFGSILKEQKKALFIHFQCSDKYSDETKFNKALIDQIELCAAPHLTSIKESIDEESDDNIKRLLMKRFNSVVESFSYETDDLKNSSLISTTLNNLSLLYPIFFMVDEIQDLHNNEFINQKGNEETYLHYFSNILKEFLNTPILIVLSGTRYSILSQIGYKIGSPIRGKVEPMVLSNLDENEINLYITKLSKKIFDSMSGNDEERKDLFIYISNFHQFLSAFSGGHGRTIERLTNLFIKKIITIPNRSYLNYGKFTEDLQRIYLQKFKNNAISKSIEETLKILTTDKHFSTVKSWIISKSHSGLYLGSIPNDYNEVASIVYTLVNVGLIFQNGDDDYYITSYFHLKVFYNVFDSEHQLFIHQVLNNRFFTLMCGGSRGFGFTFEDILLSSFFLMKDENLIKNLPFNPLKLLDIKKISTKIDWASFSPDPHVLYSSPSQKGIDAAILENNCLILVQITTLQNPKWGKVKELLEYMELIAKIKKKQKIVGCFISLFDVVNVSKEIPENLTLITGKSLNNIIGKKLFTHLLSVKKALI